MKKISVITIISVLALTGFVVSCASEPKVSKEPAIQELIAEGRFEEARNLFSTKVDVNGVDENGDTALHAAARINEADLCSFLIIKGADTEVKNNDGDTALHVAIKNDALETARVLSMVQGDIFAKDANNISALELALSKGDDWYDAMITAQSGLLRDLNGETIVHYFVRTRDEKAIDYCIKKELPLSVRSSAGQTPLHLAFENVNEAASIRIAASLLKANCDTVRGDFAYFEDCVKARNTILRFHDGQTPLHIATISGHTGIVEYLIKERTANRLSDVLGAQDISGNTPLHEAVRYGRTDIVKTLVSCGANVNAMDALGKTPLLILVPKEKQGEIYQILISNKADVRLKDMYGDSVFHIATMSNSDVSVLQILYSAGADINERNKQGVTPLAVAVQNKLESHIAFYANNGADIHAEDKNKETPLTRAFKSENFDIIQTLITRENVRSYDSAGNSPLHVAIMNKASVEVVKYIVSSKAELNARNRDGNTALMLALKYGRQDIGEILVENEADIFIANNENNSPLRIAFTDLRVQEWLLNSKTLQKTDGSGNTPLHYAAEWKYDSAVISLIERGALVNAKNSNGETPVFAAIKADSPMTIEILHQKGAVLDTNDALARDNLGNTPVHACVRWNAKNSIRMVTELGSQINAQNISGKSALSDAARSGKREMAVLLLELGADVNSTDSTGKTPLFDAVENNDEKLVNLLLKNGANPSIQEMYGRNAYHEAALSANIEIIDAVRKAGGNPLSRDVKGDSPFSLVLNSNIQIIEAVLGENRTVVDSDGNTPVHISVEKNAQSYVLKSLLDKNYPENQRNGKGKTPLYLAVEKGNTALAKVLIDKGADPFIASNSGESALSIVLKKANSGKNKDILEMIAKQEGGRKRDMQGDSILHYAAKMCSVETVEYLLSLNLDRNAKNISGEKPSDVASRWGKADVARLLQ